MARQLLVLGVVWQSNKLNLDKPENTQILEIVFCCVMGTLYLLIQFALFRARKSNDTGRVANPGLNMVSDSEKAADGSVSNYVYDRSKLSESKMQLVMSACITGFVHFKWGYTQPLLIMSKPARLTPPPRLASARLLPAPLMQM